MHRYVSSRSEDTRLDAGDVRIHVCRVYPSSFISHLSFLHLVSCLLFIYLFQGFCGDTNDIR